MAGWASEDSSASSHAERAKMLTVLSKFVSLTKKGHDPKQVTVRGDERDWSVSRTCRPFSVASASRS